MEIEFDQVKSEKNRLERDLPFDLVATFEQDSAMVWPDSRYEYGERRFCAIGYIGFRLYHLVFTTRGESVKVISLRKAKRREINLYAET
jgi:uncharacterized protein